jgi:hypothetical protein
MSAEQNPAPGRAVADVTDDEIVDACASFGADGFDAEDEDNLATIAAAVGLGSDDEDAYHDQIQIEGIEMRLSAMLGGGRLEEQGCYGVRLTWAEWGRRIEAAVGVPCADKVAALLAGEAAAR